MAAVADVADSTTDIADVAASADGTGLADLASDVTAMADLSAYAPANVQCREKVRTCTCRSSCVSVCSGGV